MSRAMQIAVLTLAVVAAAVAGDLKADIHVTELPPEAIPTGTCMQSQSGYLGIVEKDKTERTKLTDAEIGKYVQKRLAEGYSVSLYPQTSGRIFTQQICHPMKP